MFKVGILSFDRQLLLAFYQTLFSNYRSSFIDSLNKIDKNWTSDQSEDSIRSFLRPLQDSQFAKLHINIGSKQFSFVSMSIDQIFSTSCDLPLIVIIDSAQVQQRQMSTICRILGQYDKRETIIAYNNSKYRPQYKDNQQQKLSNFIQQLITRGATIQRIKRHLILQCNFQIRNIDQLMKEAQLRFSCLFDDQQVKKQKQQKVTQSLHYQIDQIKFIQNYSPIAANQSNNQSHVNHQIHDSKDSKRSIAFKAALLKVQQIVDKYSSRNKDECISSVFEKDFEEASHTVNKNIRAQFCRQIQQCQQIWYYWQVLQKEDTQSQQQNLQTKAINSIKKILQKYNASNITECLEDIFKKQYSQASYKVKKYQRQNFLIQIKECSQLNAYWQSLKMAKRNEAQLAIKVILEQYNIRDELHEECIKEILERDEQQASYKVKKDKRRFFLQKINQCQKIKAYFQQLEGNISNMNPSQEPIMKSEQPQDLSELSKKQASIFIKKYDAFHADECLSDVLAKNFESAASYIRKDRRSQFINEIRTSQILQQFWLKNIGKQNSIEQVSQQIMKILLKFNIQDKNQCLNCILEDQIQAATAYIIPKKKADFLYQLSNSKIISQYIELKKAEGHQNILKLQNNLRVLCQSFNIEQIQQCVNDLLEGNLQDAKLAVSRSKRHEFESAIMSYSQYKKYIFTHPQKKELKLRKAAEQSLKIIIAQYKVIDAAECLQQILLGDMQRAKLNVKSAFRPQFVKKILQNKEYVKYRECKNLQSIQTIRTVAESALRLILKRYVADVDDCLNILLNQGISKMINEVKKEKRVFFQKQIEGCSQYRKFIADSTQDQQNKQVRQIIDCKTNQSTSNFITKLTSKNIYQLKQSLGTNTFYEKLEEFKKQQTFKQFIIKNESKLYKQVSYFYYFLEDPKSIDQFFTIFDKQYFENNKFKQKKWIAQYLQANFHEKIELVNQQLQLLKQINNQIYSEKAIQLYAILQYFLQILTIKWYCESKSALLNFLKSKNIDYQINKLASDISIIQDNGDPFMKRKKTQFNISLKYLLKAFKVTIFEDFLHLFLSKSLQNQYKVISYQQNLPYQKIQIGYGFNNKKQMIYLQNKKQAYEINLIKLFTLSFQEQINKEFVNVTVDKQNIKIYFAIGATIDDIFKFISKKKQKKVAFQQYFIQIIFGTDKKSKSLHILSSEIISIKPQYINLFKKTQLKLVLRNQIFKFIGSKQLPFEQLRAIISHKLNQIKQISINQNIQLQGKFNSRTEMVPINESIENIEQKLQVTLFLIKITINVNVIVYFEGKMLTFSINSSKSTADLKMIIFKKLSIPPELQILSLGEQQKPKQLQNCIIQSIAKDYTTLTLKLNYKQNLSFYGFYENYPMKFQDFSKFFVERNNDIQDLVDSCSLKNAEEHSFFNQLIRLIFSTIKRRFPFSYIISQVRKGFFNKSSQQIWSTSDFTDYFLLYYILYNSQRDLRIQIMNIVKQSLPLPLFFRKFKSINSTQNQYQINNQISWFLQPSFTITCIGLHSSAKNQEQRGKTFLNNQILFTNFQSAQEKHPISHGCPQISIKILRDIKQINVIEIPAATHDKISNRILKDSNMIIINSWKDSRETSLYIRELKKSYGIVNVICFLRDRTTRQQTIAKIKDLNLDNSDMLELYNLQQNSMRNKQLPFIDILRDKVWSYINNAYSLWEKRKSKISNIFFENQLQDKFDQQMSKIKISFLELNIVFKKYQKLKQLKRQNAKSQLDKIEELNRQIIKTGIAPPFKSLIQFINKNKDNADLLLLRFRQNLKHLKNQFQRKYMIINKYKKKLVLVSKTDEKSYKDLISKAIKQIKKLPLMNEINIKAEPSTIIQQLSSTFQHYQNNIRPNLFTIQSAWRELQYLSGLKEDLQIDNVYVSEMLVNMKRKQLQKYQPFQIIDGDLLQMPRKTLKRIFQGCKDTVAVITILGPQSSGKSTLLNFLFGCDFGTSQGRCTRGVYGTYFKFSNLFMSHCQGVLLIDTQGLFANVNKKDSSRRKDFDAKLVLFCLSVSDYVLINTKGNLDSESTRILQSSLDRFSAISQQNMKWPQILLVLNQNNSANLTNSQADINKLREIFCCQNSVSLNQAYKLTQLTSRDINMLPQDQNLVIKKPRSEFLTLTNQLQSLIINKIENKHSFQPISEVIDSMERIWSTIETFPDLGKSVSKKIQEIQKQVSKWHMQKVDNIVNQVESLFQKLKQNISFKKQAQQNFSDLINNIKAQFQSLFLNQKQVEKLSDDEKIRVQLMGKKQQLSYENFKFQFFSRIQDHQKSLLAEKCKSQGSQHIKQAIRQVKKLQRDDKVKLSKEDKRNYFENAFNKSLQRIKSATGSDQLLQNYFDRIYQYYKNATMLSTINRKSDTQKDGSKAGLPKAEWSLDSRSGFGQYSTILLTKIFEVTGNESNKIIEFRNCPPTKILQQTSKTDAKLNYFKMREYFSKVPVQYLMEIQLDQLQNSINIDQLLTRVAKQFDSKIEQNKKIRQIFDQLNKCFSYFGFKIKVYNQFQVACKKIVSMFEKFKSLFYDKIGNIVLQFSPKKQVGQPKSAKQVINLIEIKMQNQPMDVEYSSDQVTAVISSLLENDKNAVKTINKYLHRQKFQETIKNIIRDDFKFNNNNIKEIITKQIQLSINYTEIQKQIQDTSSYKKLAQLRNGFILNLLNKDAQLLGLQFQNYMIFQQSKNKKISLKIKKISKKQYKGQEQFYKQLKKLTYIDHQKLKRHCIKSSQGKQKDNYYILGSFKQENFQVKNQYQHTKQLQSYMDNDVSITASGLRSEVMKKFVYSELINKQSFNKLFNNITNIIYNSPESFTNQSVKNIYIDVNRQIVQFNNDLNQVSYKLTLLFTGHLHLYAIYMIWKKNSQFILQKANKPYNDFLEAKQKQLSFFMSQISNNQQKRSKGQVTRFMDSVLNYFKKIADQHKHKINRMQANRFKEENRRQYIQDKLDHQCFSHNSSSKDWVNYLENPASMIEDQYSRLTQLFSDQLNYKYKNCDDLNDLLRQLKQLFSRVVQKFKSQGLHEDAVQTDIVGIKKKKNKQISVADIQVSEQISSKLMNYLLDLLTNSEKESYQLDDFTIQIKSQWKKSKISRQSSRSFQTFIRALKAENMSITKFYSFINSVNKKINDMQPYEQKEKKKNQNAIFSTKAQNLLIRTDQDYNDFRELVQVKICREQCPGCQRICGVQESHTNNHQCKYGHQMRALGGVKLVNGDASVIRCQDVPLMSQIQYNGKKMTWKQFKHYWQSKPQGSWNFQDLKEQSKKQLFIKAWDIAGPYICEKNEMKFVKSNALDGQKLQLYGGPIHYIFAIDRSGSMGHGTKWKDLKEALSTAINTIRDIRYSQQNVKISILLFTRTCIPYLLSVSPSKINLNFAEPAGQGTDFKPIFQKVHEISKKSIKSQTIKFIFMTDGQAAFPEQQVQLLQKLRQSYPNKFEYSGIQFRSTSTVMKLLQEKLEGTNSISHNCRQLTSAYLEIINRKIS